MMAKSIPVIRRFKILLLHAGFTLSISVMAEKRGGVGRKFKKKTAL